MHILTGLLVSAFLGKKKEGGKTAPHKPSGFLGILEVRHYFPGRLRLNAPILKNEPAGCSGLEKTLKGIEGINNVTCTPATGSILLRYNKNTLTPEILIAACLRILNLTEETEKKPVPALSKELKAIMRSLNRAAFEKSGGIIDVSSLIPLALLGWGAYTIATKGLAIPSGFTLIWWAYKGLFDEQGGNKK